MVSPGKPKSFIAFHAMVADNNILDGFVQCVAHVKRAGYVGGRDYNSKRFAVRANLRLKILVFFPNFVPLLLYCSRVVGFRNGFHWRIFWAYHDRELYIGTEARARATKKRTKKLCKNLRKKIIVFKIISRYNTKNILKTKKPVNKQQGKQEETCQPKRNT
jgi:hypothetical protein